MDTIKGLLDKYAKSVIAKYMLRALVYGVVAISTWLHCTQPANDTLAQVADWAATVFVALVMWGLDKYSHKSNTDTARAAGIDEGMAKAAASGVLQPTDRAS